MPNIKVRVNRASDKDQEAIALAVAVAMRAAGRRRELMAELEDANDELRQALAALERVGLSQRSIAVFTGLSFRQVQHFTTAKEHS